MSDLETLHSTITRYIESLGPTEARLIESREALAKWQADVNAWQATGTDLLEGGRRIDAQVTAAQQTMLQLTRQMKQALATVNRLLDDEAGESWKHGGNDDDGI